MDELLIVEEGAAYLKVSKSTIRRWCLKAKLPAFKIEREWRIQERIGSYDPPITLWSG